MNFVVGTLIFAQLPQDVIDARDIVDMDNKGNYEQEQILSSSNSPLRLSQPGVDPWNAAAAPCSDEQRRAWDRYEADFYRAEENSFNFMMVRPFSLIINRGFRVTAGRIPRAFYSI
jgi:hypothetical protein